MKYTKGQKVFIKTTGNAARYRGSEIIPGEVITVGRKYVTVRFGYSSIKFNSEEEYKQESKYSAEYILYETEQEILDENEVDNLSARLRKAFSYYGKAPYTLEQLRAIAKIIELEEQDEK